MRILEKETTEVVRRETKIIKDEVTCDLCGARAKAQHARPDGAADMPGVNWTDGRGRYSSYDFDIIAVRRATGKESIELVSNGRLEITEFHVCPACWDKLASFIGLFRGATGWRDRIEW